MNDREIRAWMVLQGLAAKDVARALGVSPTAVYNFLKGKMRSQRMRKWFVRKGCPAVHFGTGENRRAA